MVKVYLFLLIVGLFGSVGYAGYNYYLWSQETMATLRENNVKLEAATITLQATVESMTANAAKNEELNKNLTMRLQESQAHLDKLRSVFAKIDLTMEALTDANNLEERVNNAVNKLIGRIQSETDPTPASTDVVDSVREQ